MFSNSITVISIAEIKEKMRQQRITMDRQDSEKCSYMYISCWRRKCTRDLRYCLFETLAATIKITSNGVRRASKLSRGALFEVFSLRGRRQMMACQEYSSIPGPSTSSGGVSFTFTKRSGSSKARKEGPGDEKDAKDLVFSLEAGHIHRYR